MSTKKRIVIVGATSSIAEHCARLWINEPAVEMTLVGRDEVRLARIAADLRVRNAAATVGLRVSGFTAPQDIDATVAAVCEAGLPDIVLIAHGMLPDQAACQDDLAKAQEAIEVNAVSPVLFAEAFARRMGPRGGTLGLIGSVAGDRGRKSNYVYGAAKGLVDRYAQGMQQRLAATALKVVLIKPGPTATPMTAGMSNKSPGKLAPVDAVARNIVDGMARGQAVIYTPGKWRLIMLVIRHLPAFIFNKMDI